MCLHEDEQWLELNSARPLLSSNPSTQKQSVVSEIVFSLCFATILVALDTREHCAHTLINTMDAPSQYIAPGCLWSLWLRWAEMCSRGCNTVLYASLCITGDLMLIFRSIILFWVTAGTDVHAFICKKHPFLLSCLVLPTWIHCLLWLVSLHTPEPASPDMFSLVSFT